MTVRGLIIGGLVVWAVLSSGADARAAAGDSLIVRVEIGGAGDATICDRHGRACPGGAGVAELPCCAGGPELHLRGMPVGTRVVPTLERRACVRVGEGIYVRAVGCDEVITIGAAMGADGGEYIRLDTRDGSAGRVYWWRVQAVRGPDGWVPKWRRLRRGPKGL